MNSVLKAAFALALSVLAPACAITPPATPAAAMCNFDRYGLEVEISEEQRAAHAVAAPQGPRTLGGEIQGALRARAADPRRAASPPSMLYMSGGSLNGAFGAGFLNGWQHSGGAPGSGLPRFDVVTGISTGSILATFAFVGDTDPLVGEGGYAIVDERQLLTPIIRTRNGKLVKRSLIDAARRGAVADLAPLRQRLHDEITPAVLASVQQGRQENRRLYVGVVDVDSGKAVALDMTEMADRFMREADPDRRALLRGCYVEAIVASSSAPMAATPVFIDNRMYVDGGARFGMFSDELGALLEPKSRLFLGGAPAPDVFVIVNGDLQISERCGKADQTLCQPPHPPSGGLYGPHAEWNLVGLAARSEQILVNQVYRLSFDRIRQQAAIGGEKFRYVRIEPDMNRHIYTMAEPRLGSGTLSCAEWQAMDQELLHPVQFYPRFMHCLIDYGKSRAAQERWPVRTP